MKKTYTRLYLAVLLLVASVYMPSCSSLPSFAGETVPAESDGFPDDTAGNDEVPSLAESAESVESADSIGEGGDETAASDNDRADIQKRVEEELAYLDTPVNPDLPEPYYLFPEPESTAAEPPAAAEEAELSVAEALPEEPAELASDTEPPSGLDEPAEPPAEIADSTEGEVPDPAETVVEEAPPPPPPASLLPPREIAVIPPPRKPDSAIPASLSSLPPQPARVPPSETKQGDAGPQILQTIAVPLGEIAEISLPGSGWVYLGEMDERKGIPYQRRRVSADGQVFVFRPGTAGFYRLKFKKQELLRGTDTDGIVEVTVVEAAVKTEKAVEVEKAAETKKVLQQETVALAQAADTDAALPATTAMIDAIAVIDGEPPVTVIDDLALWNRGRELESPGENRDMKGALAAYKTLVRDYPQSEHYTDSKKRIAYIERFFVNIR